MDNTTISLYRKDQEGSFGEITINKKNNLKGILHQIKQRFGVMDFMQLDVDDLIDSINDELDFGIQRIICIDDELEILSLLNLQISGLGHYFRGFSTAIRAEKFLLEEGLNYDLIITDNIMPDISGEDLVRKVKTRHPDLNIVMYTGNPDKILKPVKIPVYTKPTNIQIIIQDNICNSARDKYAA